MMCDRIMHRGPDMYGEYLSQDNDVVLGFRRLSIIDLSREGCQPMLNDSGDICIVFNGEIYNFSELRIVLQEKGYSFRGHSDSEVLLKAYIEYGTSVLNKLRGMFAFVLYDRTRNILFGARDFFGIKPLYYSLNSDGSFLFGSEIKSFLDCPLFKKQFNEESLRPYLSFQYSASTNTFFKNVYELEPANAFIFNLGSRQLKIFRYWNMDFDASGRSFDECVDAVFNKVSESVKIHSLADVPTGAYLSGGVDSSFVVASMKPDKTFSVGFEQDGFDETSYAAELSKKLGIKNYSRILSPEECMDSMGAIQYFMDEPHSDPAILPSYFLAQLAAEHVKVVLSGEGSDELYAGYPRYEENPLTRKYKMLPAPFRLAMAKAVKGMPYFKGRSFVLRSSGYPEEDYIGQARIFDRRETVSILKDNYRVGPDALDVCMPYYERVKGKDDLTKKLFIDMNLWLPGDILLAADKMSMAHSLELRVPFLDKDVFEDACSIPSNYKITHQYSKYVLRVAANRILPDEWATRPKLGFPVPICQWFRQPMFYNMIGDYFSSSFAEEFFDTDKLFSLLKKHRSGAKNNQKKLFCVLSFLIWYEQYFIKN